MGWKKKWAYKFFEINIWAAVISRVEYKTHKPHMFGVIDDKPEGVARGIYHV